MFTKKKALLWMIILLKRIKDLNVEGGKKKIVTWSHAFTIVPTMIGHTIVVHNGREHLPIYIIDRR
jgi:small subunit ribosomal protein S19